MAFAVNDLITCKHVMYGVDQLGLNVRHFRVSAVAGPGVTAQNIADALATLYGPLYAPLIGNSTSYFGTIVQKILPLPQAAAVQSIVASVPGTGGVDLMARQVSGIISIRTLLAGRSRRGRAYIPFPTETMNANPGAPTGGYTANLLALSSQMEQDTTVVSGGDTCTLRPVVWSRRLGIMTDVERCIPEAHWATQRRRGDFGRLNPNPFVT